MGCAADGAGGSVEGVVGVFRESGGVEGGQVGVSDRDGGCG